MLISEILNESAVLIWGRKKDRLVRKYKCVGGVKDGRVVSKATTCNTPINPFRSMSFVRTLNAKGYRMRKKASITKQLKTTDRLSSINNTYD